MFSCIEFFTLKIDPIQSIPDTDQDIYF